MSHNEKREFTPAQFALVVQDAPDNWDWNIVAEEESPEHAQAMQSYLDFGSDAEDYARQQFADDDGIIRIDGAFSNVWDMLDEYATGYARSAAASAGR